MQRPLLGSPRITQVWGEPSTLYRLGYHTGVDYGVLDNTKVVSPTNGTIIQAGDGRASSDGRGFFLKIKGDDGVEHNLYHLVRWHKSSGRVTEGEHIADSDNTGLSSGPHLHWETRRSPYELANNFNPADWLYSSPPPATAPTELKPHQRLLTNETGVNQRSEPMTSAPVIKEWAYEKDGDNTYSFKAYVHGESVNGSDIWYVGLNSGGYFHSRAFANPTTDGLPNQTPETKPQPVPTPVEPPKDMPVAFKPDDASVIAVYPSPDVDELPTQIPQFIVVHQWDDPSVKPKREGVINHLTQDNGINAHYVVDDSGVYQIIPENKRAQHAGKLGNDGLGIECDPNGGEAMYKHLRLLVANIRVRHGRLDLRKHSDFMETRCPDSIDILRIEPISVPPTIDYDKENNDLLKQILATVKQIFEKITSVFK